MDFTLEHWVAAAVLALLAYAGVTCTCATLAARLKGQKLRHNLVAESRRRRAIYLASLPGAQGNDSVEVVEDEPAEAATPAEPARRAA